MFETGNQPYQNIVNFARRDRISCLERMCQVNLMMKMCQVVIPQCEGYAQHKTEVVDYYEPFRDFLDQILKVYTQKRKF